MFTGIHHVAILSVNYEKAKWFYREVLAMTLLQENYRSDSKTYKCDLSFEDGVQIELFGFEQAPPRLSYPEACGLRHLAVKVESLEKAITHIRSYGWSVEKIRVDPYTSARFTFLKDPDDTPIELYELPQQDRTNTQSLVS